MREEENFLLASYHLEFYNLSHVPVVLKLKSSSTLAFPLREGTMTP